MPPLLDYGPPAERRLSPSRRDVSGAVFIVMAILAGLIAVAGTVGAVMLAMDPAVEPGSFFDWAVVVGGLVIAGLLCLGAILAAVRRLNPRK